MIGRRTPTEKLLRDLERVVEDAEALLQVKASEAGEKVDHLRERARASLEQARSRIVDAEDEALEHVREVTESAEAYIHENPWQAIGVAASIGLVLGLLIGRR